MAFTVLYAIFEGVMGNTPLMAVRAMNASDAQLQVPLAMASVGLFASTAGGDVMARRRKMPFVLAPGFTAALVALMMGWASDPAWFLVFAGLISICDFLMRPAVPSIMRSVYPEHCRSRVSGTLRQYGAVSFLGATLLSAWALSVVPARIAHIGIAIEVSAAGLICGAAFLCFAQLPHHGDGSREESDPTAEPPMAWSRATLAPWRDRRFVRYLVAIFVFSFANLFHQGVIPAFFARDLGLGYVQASLLLHIIPNLTAFLAGGYLTSWFERTSVWRSYALVTLLWGLDPLLIAVGMLTWPVLVLARILRGPATLGSMVIAFFTGVHSFARPGSDTSRYMGAQFLVNGLARLSAPIASAVALSYLSRRSVILAGGFGVLAASALFWWYGRTAEAKPLEADSELIEEGA